MRKLFFILIIFSAAINTQAQTQLFAVGGTNTTKLAILNETNTNLPSGGNAWQTGITAQIHTGGKGFLYTGVFYETKKVERSGFICCAFQNDITYRPHYISVPVGGGVEIPVTRSLRIKVWGGASLSWTAGGHVDGSVIAYTDLYSSAFISPVTTQINRKMNIGGAANDDMTEWNLGLQLGASIAWKKIELQFTYNHGLQNMAPDKFTAYDGNLNYKYRTIAFNLAYNIFTFKK